MRGLAEIKGTVRPCRQGGMTPERLMETKPLMVLHNIQQNLDFPQQVTAAVKGFKRAMVLWHDQISITKDWIKDLD